MILGKEQIYSFLPHRPPFLFVDSLEELRFPDEAMSAPFPLEKAEGITAVAKFVVQEDLTVLEGHFPGNPVLPGVIQIEMMAQASCLMLSQSEELGRGGPVNVALVSLNYAKFRRPIRPGMELMIESTCTRRRGSMMSYQGEIKEAGKSMAEAGILATLMPNH